MVQPGETLSQWEKGKWSLFSIVGFVHSKTSNKASKTSNRNQLVALT
jgi:hypothetical protein